MQQLALPAAPTSACTVRRFVEAFCTHNGLPEGVRDDAVLLVSEVVGNSLRHARSEARIRVDMIGPVLRVEVADDNPDLPRLRQTPPDATGGRGLLILDRLASRWGADRNTVPPPGKIVWFELAVA